MPFYFDYHDKLKPVPQLLPARAKALMEDIKAKKLDEFGVRYLNFFSGRTGHGFCICEAPSVEAVVESHDALGLPLETKDVHEIDFTLADEGSTS